MARAKLFHQAALRVWTHAAEGLPDPVALPSEDGDERRASGRAAGTPPYSSPSQHLQQHHPIHLLAGVLQGSTPPQLKPSGSGEKRGSRGQDLPACRAHAALVDEDDAGVLRGMGASTRTERAPVATEDEELTAALRRRLEAMNRSSPRSPAGVP